MKLFGKTKKTRPLIALFFLAILVFFFPVGNFAQGSGFVTIEIPNPLRISSVEGLLSALLTSLQGVIVVISLVFIVIGALLYITSSGNEERTKTARKAIAAALIGLAIGIAAPSFLKEIYFVLAGNPSGASCYTPCAANPDSEDCKKCLEVKSQLDRAPRIVDIALRTLQFLLSIIGVLALIMLVIGSVMYITAAGNENALDSGKKIIKFALIGITVTLLSLVAVRTIAIIIGGRQ